MRIKSEKNQKKCILKLKWLKIDGCMHPLLKIDGCNCTLCTRYYKGPATIKININVDQMIS